MGYNHKTMRIRIKKNRIKADVDVHMVEIVNWLNSYDSIITSNCCEGDDEDSPYVEFVCTDTEILTSLVCLVQHVATIQVRRPNYGKDTPLHYAFWFPSIEARDKLRKYLETGKKSVLYRERMKRSEMVFIDISQRWFQFT